MDLLLMFLFYLFIFLVFFYGRVVIGSADEDMLDRILSRPIEDKDHDLKEYMKVCLFEGKLFFEKLFSNFSVFGW